MSWELLKITGKLLGHVAADCANSLTEPLREAIVDPYIERKVAEKLKPELSRKSSENQMWNKIQLGMSEEQVGELLGLPDRISPNVKTGYQIFVLDETFDESWDTVWAYERNRIMSEHSLNGFLRFKNHCVVRFRVSHANKNGWLIIEEPADS